MIISVLGLQETKKKFTNLQGIDIMPAIRKGTYKVQRSAKEKVAVYGGQNSKANPPLSKSVIIGALRDSIQVKFDKRNQIGTVFSDSEVAIYQEFGTRYQVGTPFLTPAIDENRKDINDSLESYINDQLKKVCAGSEPDKDNS